MNIFKKIIGFIMVALVLGGLVVMTCIAYGTIQALLIWAISIVCVIIIVGGMHLLLD
tara:strand:- start:262 stop:432 length:171 start_codon:yes stop_codon:yes gene_type:complete